ncbi:MAG: molecular chaperone HtpG, partial [Lachnospiraceae bacterium]|nr:molecular chaperone HtpG [Lachnospiraceae bacterium]
KDYLEIAKEKNHENQVFYVTDAIEQSQYINMFKDAELEAVYLTQAIDNPFMSQLEYKNEGVKFQRIDADVNDIFKEADAETDEDAKTSLSEIFKAALGMEQLDVKVENLKNTGLASMITVSEESRRIQEMMKMYSAQGMGMGADMFPVSETLVLNANNSLVKYVLAHKDGEHTAKICEQLYDLAKLAHGSLTPERMTKFIARSGEIMMLMTGEE